MVQKELNLGILAHVDAGKTTLTERLLFEAGVIREPGSVDAGTTQTDSLELERERGITIRSAVTSFALADVHVNLIDTPGHPDFIAEVERVLSVLDGAVLVVSAVEGVQPQTRILARALRRLAVPTLIFVNKIDRAGAQGDALLSALSTKLETAVVPMGRAESLGDSDSRFVAFADDDPTFLDEALDVLAESDDTLLATYVRDGEVSPRQVREALATATARAALNPVFFGSARTGAGVAELMTGIETLLPAAVGDPGAPLSAKVFKIERGSHEEKIVYVRVFSGQIAAREIVNTASDVDEKVTSIAVYEAGPPVQRSEVSAGAVAQLRGLATAKVGDVLGVTDSRRDSYRFAPPTMEVAIDPKEPKSRATLTLALNRLSEQDPLINVRRGDVSGRLSLSLYGEVQQEVIAETLARDYGLEVTFGVPTPICIERVVGVGASLESMGSRDNPFAAGLGLRIEPCPVGAGVDVEFDLDVRAIPIYVYKAVANFEEGIRGYVASALEEGLRGWSVTDCRATITACEYAPPGTSARDYRLLTPLVLARALEQAGTVVCEPYLNVRVEAPSTSVSDVLSAVSRMRSTPPKMEQAADQMTISLRLPVDELLNLQRQLPGLTHGEGLLATEFAGYRPVAGVPPERQRLTSNPLNRQEYLMRLAGRARGSE